ncbi:hypothetical protein D3C72_1003860 [compost metagenome]
MRFIRCQDGSGGRGVVGARGRRETPVLRRAQHDAMLEHGRQVFRMVFQVPAVAQETVRQAGRADGCFRDHVLGGQAQRRRIGAQDAGIGQQRYAGALGRIDDVLVLLRALAHFARRDQQYLRRALECRVEAGAIVVIGLAHLHAPGGQVGGLGRVAHGGNDVGCGDGLEQAGDDVLAQIACGAGDDDHDFSLVRGW